MRTHLKERQSDGNDREINALCGAQAPAYPYMAIDPNRDVVELQREVRGWYNPVYFCAACVNAHNNKPWREVDAIFQTAYCSS